MSKRWTTIGAVAGTLAGAAAGLAGAGYYWLLRRPLPRTRGTLRLAGLHNPAEVLRDRWGIPHIYAESTRDLMFAQGFVHAQDRLWQMDFQRRLVAGRLSEVLGADTVAVDRWIRTLTLWRVVEREVDLLDDDLRAELEAYCAGVNARIAQGRLPIEFTLLRYRPEPWTLADTLCWNKLMSWALSFNWETEILRAQLIEHLGPERAAELEPDYAPEMPTIIPSGTTLGTEALRRARAARPFTGPGAGQGLGSNNWAIAGSRTTSGAPLLANDMHLPMNLPCIWYENHLVGGDMNVTGITFPGVPGVVSGHNGHVAWGFTNGFPDVQDLYLERLRRTEDGPGQAADQSGCRPEGRVQYEFQGEWYDAEVHREEIRVKGGETVVEEVVVTRHGPIINSLSEHFAGEEPMALRWTSLEPEPTTQVLSAVIGARNCLEFREALRRWTAPVQNVVYADAAGNIAYSLAGKVPIRARGDGRVPVPGWTGEYEWTGYIPFEELPHLYNPTQGYIATANNRIVDDEYAYFLSADYCTGDRAKRIVDLIEATERADMAYVQDMQFDQVSLFGRAIAGHLSELQTQDAELGSVVALMAGWDGGVAADSAAAAVYEVFIRRMIALALEDKLGPLTMRYAGQGPTPGLYEGTLFGHRSLEWLQKVLAEPDSHWFDLGNGESRDDVMRLALRETVDFLKAELGPDVGDWAWGELHSLTYAHLLGRVKPLDKLFNRGPFPLGGDGTTVWATGANYHDLGNDLTTGPPFRFVADLGDLNNCLGLLSPGQSGQPGSPNYDDQVQAWFEGNYHPMYYAREDVVREAQAWLELLPKRR